MSCREDGCVGNLRWIRCRADKSASGTGKLCIEVKPTDKISYISEYLCIGCGICVKKCVLAASLP
jgi:ATP-binding cassette subfamily E protein 1